MNERERIIYGELAKELQADINARLAPSNHYYVAVTVCSVDRLDFMVVYDPQTVSGHCTYEQFNYEWLISEGYFPLLTP